MATVSEKLAASLEVLRGLQEDGRHVFRSDEMKRADRERLHRSGFLEPVIKGWWISSSPDRESGDSTLWWASFWEFCSSYCRERFGEEWHLSPQQSLLLHAEHSAVPRQVVVYATRGSNNVLALPFETSIYDLRQEGMPPEEDLTSFRGVRVFTAAAALTRTPESFYQRYPVEARVALASVQDPSDLLRPLLEEGRTVVAGRLAGAMRWAGRVGFADELVDTMRAAGHDLRETDPFSGSDVPDGSWVMAAAPPIVQRLRALWSRSREQILELLPEAPGLRGESEEILRRIDEVYRTDAYHSLSIEGYRVTEELIEKVRAGDWSPDQVEEDRRNRDARAARGYWQAFRGVRSTVAAVLDGEDVADLVRDGHRAWYRELFGPCVIAGLIPPSALAGYRNDAVYLRGSRHVPPRWEAVRDAMPALWDLIAEEPEPGVRAVLGHWLFGYVHPYPDGNGRMARFLMNVLLVSGGYPWTVVRVEDRAAYLGALERASVDAEVGPFGMQIVEAMERSAAVR